MLPIVSVVIPCYKVWEYIDEALKSVFDQTYQNIEIWVGNDGCSTDAAAQAMDKFSRNPRINQLSLPHQGHSVTRNELIKHAKGKYIVCLDADDKLHPDYITRCVELLESESDLGLVSPQVRYFGTSEQSNLPRQFSIGSFLIENSLVVTSMFRREDWQAVGGFDPSFKLCEDYDFFHSLLGLGRRLHKQDDIIFYYRRHPTSLTAQVSLGESLAARRFILEKHRSLYIRHLDEIILESFYDRLENHQHKRTIDWLNSKLRTAIHISEPQKSVQS